MNIEELNFITNEYKIKRKGNKPADMLMSIHMATAIMEYIENERSLVNIDTGLLKNQGPLFPSFHNNPPTHLSVRQIQRIVEKYTTEVLGKKLGEHRLRAAFITYVFDSFGMKTGRVTSDHNNIQTTQLYAKERANTQKAVIKEIDKIHE